MRGAGGGRRRGGGGGGEGASLEGAWRNLTRVRERDGEGGRGKGFEAFF